MRPGAACGDPRAAPGYLEASRHAQGGAPEGGCKRSWWRAWPPQTPKTYKLVAMGYKTYKLVAMLHGCIGSQPRCSEALP